MPYQARKLAFGLGLEKAADRAVHRPWSQALYRLFIESDASLVEVNPLIVTTDGRLRGAGRQDQHRRQRAVSPAATCSQWRDPSQEDEKENEASEHDLNYVSLDGDIACMVNGAGWRWRPWI